VAHDRGRLDAPRSPEPRERVLDGKQRRLRVTGPLQLLAGNGRVEPVEQVDQPAAVDNAERFVALRWRP
jgi:hypothetical protein